MFALLVKPVLAGNIYHMDFPIKLNDVEVGQVSAGIDGFSLASISGTEFHKNLNKVLSDSVNSWLTEQGDTAITVAEYKEKGIELTFKPQDMVIEIKLLEAAMSTDRLTYGDKKYVVEPNQYANWAVLNNFNLNHQRSNNNDSFDSKFEWLFEGNVGGAKGVNFDGSGFWDHSDDSGSKFYRGDISLFYDEPEKPRRYTLGDTQNRVNGHLSSYQVGGFSMSKAYSQLQPQRNLSPGNSQVFVLPRHATLEVFVNDFLISRVRLRPGRYDINDLPLTSGSNNVKITATYADGETEDFNFTTHYNAQLLADGLSDYSVVMGFPSSIQSNVYHYEDKPLLAGMYEYGWAKDITLGVNGVTYDDGHVVGTTATFGNPWGNLSFRYTASKGNSNFGQAFTAESEHSVFGQSQFGSPNLRLGYETKRDFSPNPWLEQSGNTRTDRIYFDYSIYVTDTVDFNAFGSVQQNAAKQLSKDFTAQLNWRDYRFNISAGYNYGVTNDVVDVDENRFFLNFTWSLYNRKSKTRSRARYNSRNKTTSASYTRVNNGYLNEYGYQLQLERGDNTRREQARGSFTSQMFRVDANIENQSRTEQLARGSAAINLSTSVGVADGHIGIGTNITAPFAVVEKHKTLKGHEVLVNVNRNQRPQTKTGDSVGALVNLGTGYTAAQFNVDVPDAPFGYDWGPGTYRLAGGSSTGHYFLVGSDLSYTIMGSLVDAQGEPVALKRGKVVHSSGLSKSIFTNRTGRFVVEGVGPGDFTVELKDSNGAFVVEESDVRFVQIGQIKLSNKGDK